MKPFKSSDQGLAAYLVAKNMELLGTVPTDDPKRLNFVFIDTPERDDLVEQYLSGQGQVGAKHYAHCIKQVNRALKTPLTSVD